MSDGQEQKTPDEIGGYQVKGRLGEGGMGEVFLVHDAVFDRELALKIMRVDGSESGEAVSRFFTEGRLTGQLQHPVVPPVYALELGERGGGNGGGPCYYTMKYLRGQTLETVLARQASLAGGAEGEWNRQRLLTVFAQICRGVAYAHSRGVIHRDIKPGNIVLGTYGEVYLLDWGLAKALGRPLGLAAAPAGVEGRPDGGMAHRGGVETIAARTASRTASPPLAPAANDHAGIPAGTPAPAVTLRGRPVDSDAKTVLRPPTGGIGQGGLRVGGDDRADGSPENGARAPSGSGHRTLDGQIIGTPQYMAPEQVQGAADSHDHRTDIYALGVLLWELITGKPMRDGSLRMTELIKLAAEGWRPELSAAGRELWIEPDLQEIVWKATMPLPADRYPSAEAMAADLQGWLDGRRRWRSVYDLDFRTQPDSDSPPEGWRVLSGVWRVRKGALTPGSDAPSVVHLPEAVLDDVRIEIEGWIDDQATGELAALLGAPRAPVQEFCDDGYRLEFGAESLTSHRLVRNGLAALTVNDPPAEPGVRYRLVAERENDWLRLTVDGRPVLATRDFFPLAGERLGLYASGTGVHIERVAVSTAGVPRRLTCLAIPDHYAGRGLWQQALSEYRRIIDGHPGSPEAAEAMFKAGQCLLSLWDEAQQRVAAMPVKASEAGVAAVSPAGGDANLGTAQAGCLAEAEVFFRSLQATPLKAWSAIGMAEQARRQGGSPAEAIAHLMSALRSCTGPQDPGLADLVLFMQVSAERAQRGGAFDNAVALWRALHESATVERSTRLRALTRVAALLGAQRRTGEAIHAYETALAEFREYRYAGAEALLEIGTMHRVAGAPALALAMYERVGQEFPDQVRVCRGATGEIARLHREQGRPAEALAAYEELFAAAEGQRSVQAETLRAMGEMHSEAGRNEEAVTTYRKVVEEFADQPISCAKAWRELSVLYRELGRKEESKAALKEMLRLQK